MTKTNLINVQSTKDKNEPGERGVTGDGLQPIIVNVKQNHLRLRGFQDQISEFLHLEARLEGQLQLGTLSSFSPIKIQSEQAIRRYAGIKRIKR